MEDAVMEQALRPYAAAGVALLGAGMVAVMSVVTPPALPKLQTSAVRLVDSEADALALLVSAIDPGAFTNGISATATDSLGQLAVSIDNLIDLGGTPYITGADNLATDLLPLLDVTGLLGGVTTSIDSLLGDLGDLGNLSTLLSELGNLPTATDIANDVVSALTGPGGVLTTITTDLNTLPSTLTTDLIGGLTGTGDSLTTITGDLGTITTDLGGISTELGTLEDGLNEILGHFSLGLLSGL
jgi:hypothetical protein